MSDFRLDVQTRQTEGVQQAVRLLGTRAKPALVSSINRVTRDLRARVVRTTTQFYNVRPRILREYVRIRGATRNNISGSAQLQRRALPINAFSPRVRLQRFTYQRRGQQVTQTLPAVFVTLLKSEGPQYVAPAFPLQQRRTGVIPQGEKVRRRIGSARDRLTTIRYFTFPRQFVEDVIVPDVEPFIPQRMTLELDRAYRRITARNAGGELRRNR
ncbi:hypothetical protein [Nevskia sp.]|uniref:hypothetical protein n=1 Tax=Nevskia sp. TaxID=1929292 RepID=UPI0025F8CF12|nr:hypothetical protein [Nevskia sp.]